jgi:hypothetical protein
LMCKASVLCVTDIAWHALLRTYENRNDA